MISNFKSFCLYMILWPISMTLSLILVSVVTIFMFILLVVIFPFLVARAGDEILRITKDKISNG